VKYSKQHGDSGGSGDGCGDGYVQASTVPESHLHMAMGTQIARGPTKTIIRPIREVKN
jgi:hypothetical protein